MLKETALEIDQTGQKVLYVTGDISNKETSENLVKKAVEFAKDNMRVNAVAPAVVETPIYNTFTSEEEVAEVLPTFNDFHPLGRNGNQSM